MSGSNALAAAKRRRGQSGSGYNNNVIVDVDNRQTQLNTPDNQDRVTQPITPMGILTQHHIRL